MQRNLLVKLGRSLGHSTLCQWSLGEVILVSCFKSKSRGRGGRVYSCTCEYTDSGEDRVSSADEGEGEVLDGGACPAHLRKSFVGNLADSLASAGLVTSEFTRKLRVTPFKRQSSPDDIPELAPAEEESASDSDSDEEAPLINAPLPTPPDDEIPQWQSIPVSHQPGPQPSVPPLATEPFSSRELASLEAYYVAIETHQTHAAFASNCLTIQRVAKLDLPLLSLHECNRLLVTQSGLVPTAVHVCRRGCAAYTDALAPITVDHCRALRNQDIPGQELVEGEKPKQKMLPCGLPHFRPQRESRGKPKPLEPYSECFYLDFVPRFRALFSNQQYASLLRSFHTELQAVMKLRRDENNQYAGSFLDITSGHTASHFADFFDDPRHAALGISTDGAKISMSREGDMWVWGLTTYDLPIAAGRYRRKFQFVLLVSYGVGPPSNLESFMFPIYK
jgi:hypothetical protein